MSPQTILTRHFRLASFRKNQEVIIQAVLEKKDVLVVMPTGGGQIVVLSTAFASSGWDYDCGFSVNFSDAGSGGCFASAEYSGYFN